jgi:hypothetical protein
VDLFILANKFKKLCLLFFQSRSLAELLATSRGTPVEKPCLKSYTDSVLHYDGYDRRMWVVVCLRILKCGLDEFIFKYEIIICKTTVMLIIKNKQTESRMHNKRI